MSSIAVCRCMANTEIHDYKKDDRSGRDPYVQDFTTVKAHGAPTSWLMIRHPQFMAQYPKLRLMHDTIILTNLLCLRLTG